MVLYTVGLLVTWLSVGCVVTLLVSFRFMIGMRERTKGVPLAGNPGRPGEKNKRAGSAVRGRGGR
jgi:hypothetical protein